MTHSILQEVVITDRDEILCNPPLLYTASLALCNHEEAESCIMSLSSHAAHSGHTKIIIRAVDIDDVVLAVTLVGTLDEEAKVWVSFGT